MHLVTFIDKGFSATEVEIRPTEAGIKSGFWRSLGFDRFAVSAMLRKSFAYDLIQQCGDRCRVEMEGGAE